MPGSILPRQIDVLALWVAANIENDIIKSG
jgi:hypothetical protein